MEPILNRPDRNDSPHRRQGSHINYEGDFSEGFNLVELFSAALPSNSSSPSSFSAIWICPKNRDLASLRRSLEMKVEISILNFFHSQVENYFKGFTYTLLFISPVSVEITLLRMLGNLIQAYEQGLGKPFPKEQSLLGLVDFIVAKTSQSGLQEKLKTFLQGDENKKSQISAEIGQTLLSIAFPNKAADLGFTWGSNFGIWTLLSWNVSGFVQKLLIPSTLPLFALKAKGKGLKRHLPQDIKPIIKGLMPLLYEILLEGLSAHAKAKEKAAVDLSEKRLYSKAVALASTKEKTLRSARTGLLNPFSSLIHLLFIQLLTGKPDSENSLIFLGSKLLRVWERERKNLVAYSQNLQNMSEVSIQQIRCRIPLVKPEWVLEASLSKRAAHWFKERAAVVCAELGFDFAALQPYQGQWILELLQNKLAEQLLNYALTCKRSEVDSYVDFDLPAYLGELSQKIINFRDGLYPLKEDSDQNRLVELALASLEQYALQPKDFFKNNSAWMTQIIKGLLPSFRWTTSRELKLARALQTLLNLIPNEFNWKQIRDIRDIERKSNAGISLNNSEIIREYLHNIIQGLFLTLAGRAQQVTPIRDATAAVLLLIRVRFAEAKLDPKLCSQLRNYQKEFIKAVNLEKRLIECRQSLLKEDKEETRREIAVLEQALPSWESQMVMQQKKHTISQAFIPLAKTLLADIGIENLEDLPVPDFAQERLYSALTENLLPNLLMYAYTDISYFSLDKTHKKKLDSRFGIPRGEKHSTVVKNLTKCATFALHYMDNYFVTHIHSVAASLHHPSFSQKPLPHAGLTLVVSGRVLGKNPPLKTEYLYPFLRRELKGILFDFIDNIFTSLEDEENKAKLRSFVLEALRLIAEHMDVLNEAAHRQFIHTIPTSQIFRLLEERHLNHACFPEKWKLKRMEKNLQKIGQLKGKKGGEELIQKLNLENQALQNSFHEALQDKFYNKWIEWFLNHAGKRSKESLSISPLFQNNVHEWIQKHAPRLLDSIMTHVTTEPVLNHLLVELTDLANSMIEGSLKASPCTNTSVPHFPELAGIFNNLLSEIGQGAPGTWLNVVIKFKVIREKVGSNLAAELEKMLAMGSLISFLESALTNLKVPENPLLTTESEIANAAQDEAIENSRIIRELKISALQLPPKIQVLLEKNNWLFGKLYPVDSVQKSIESTCEPVRRSIVEVFAHINLCLKLADLFVESFPAKG